DAFFFSSRRRHTRFSRDWSSDVCSSDLALMLVASVALAQQPATTEPTPAPGQGPGMMMGGPGPGMMGGYGPGARGGYGPGQGMRSEERRVGTGAGCRGAAAYPVKNAIAE